MKKYRKSKRYYYYRKQKLYGVALIAVAIVSAIITDGDITAALILAPLGLSMIFSKDRILYDDDYFYEMEGKILNEEDWP